MKTWICEGKNYQLINEQIMQKLLSVLCIVHTIKLTSVCTAFTQRKHHVNH